MKLNLKSIIHLIGFLLGVPVCYYLFRIDLKTGLMTFFSMSIGYLFCYFSNRDK